MTTYLPIADTEVDPESPITTSLASRWRDNPIAMFEGDAAAPKLQHAALAADAGDLNLLGTVTITTNTSVVDIINLDATKYQDIEVVFNGMNNTVNTAVYFSSRFSIDNGVTFISSASAYGTRWARLVNAFTGAGGADSAMYTQIGNPVLGFQHLRAKIQLAKTTSARNGLWMEQFGEYEGVTIGGSINFGGGNLQATTQINAIRFYFTTNGVTASSGVFGQAVIAIYGRRRT